ncbi:MAG TPA: hemolysin family protein [Vicinamibacteria bacterium]|jgi:putative hemolysin
MLTAASIALVIILCLSAFFSGSETALMSLNRYRLRHLEERRGRQATLIRRVLTYPEKVLGTILTGNVFVNTAAGALVTYAVTLAVTDPQQQAEAITLSTLGLTALLLVFGEMVPKSLAARHPERWSLLVIRPIVFCIRLFSPAVKLLTLVSNGFLRVFGEVPRPLKHEITLEELQVLIHGSGDGAGEPGGKRQMLRNVFELSETRVSEVMVPRTEIVAVEVDAPLEDILSLIQKHRFSRIPVYRETLDKVEGLVYSKDLIRYRGKDVPFQLADVLRKPYFLPDGAKVEQALEQMQKQRVHMALVVDEHGGVEGMVTLEDLLEEIVGELSDEHEEVSPIRALPDGSYSLSGSISVKDLNEGLGLDLPEEPDYNTLAGLILTRLGRIPAGGEELAVEGLMLSVERVSHRRIVRVRAKPLQLNSEESSPGDS